MRASVGESTSWTNVVAARSWMVLTVSSTGLMRQLLREEEGERGQCGLFSA